MYAPLNDNERAGMIGLMKAVWFLVVTAGNTIAGRDPDIKLTAKQADQLAKTLDDYLKEL